MAPKNSPDPFPPNDFQGYFVKYMEEKFLRLHERIDSVDLGVKELSHIVDAIKVKDGQHYVLCKNTSEVKKIQDQIAEFEFIKKYWKVFIVSLTIFILSVIYTGYKALEELKTIQSKYEIHGNKS